MVGSLGIKVRAGLTARTESWTEMSAEEKYLLANKIFSRDPQSFKDKDADGVEDELEKGS